MTVYAFKAECLAGEKATLGFRGESGRTQVIIDATAWIEEFGEGGLLRLRHEPDEGEAYSPASQTVENGVLTWMIAASDTASVGSGRAEVWYTVDGVAVASAVFRTSVLWSITEPGTEIPTGIDDWLTRADEALATITGKADQSDLDAEIVRATEAEDDLQDQIDEIIAGGGGGGGGAVLSVNGQTGNVVLTAADVDALPDSTRIPTKTSDLVNDSGYITNAGVTSFNGQTGAVSYSAPVSSVNGQTGAVTGLATSAEVSAAVSGKADKATTLAGYGIDNAYTKNQTDAALAGKQDKLTAGANITIVNNVISAAGGQGGGAVDSVNGKTGVVVLDAEDVGALPDNTVIPTKVSDLINDEGFGTYSLPSGGIPVTDLASSVQASLGKADTALQSAPVASVNNKTGAVVLSASDVGAGTYSKPSGGIPASDLASAVQSQLIPSGGTQGQVLKKSSGADYAVEWGDESGGGGVSPEVKASIYNLFRKAAYSVTGLSTDISVIRTWAGITSWDITNTLTGCTTSNAATSAENGASYTATLTPNTNYSISSVTVEMGGTDITSTAYSNGVITIASVTGDIDITAVAIDPNIFDPSTAESEDWYIDTSSSTIKARTSGSHNALTWVEVNPSTTYKITKQLSNTFRVATTASTPTAGSSYISTIANHSGTEITITTEATAHYIAIYYWYTNNTYDETTTKNSIRVVPQ